MDAGAHPPEDDPGPQIPQNQDPEAFGSLWSTVTGFLQLYGWYVIFAGIALSFLYSKLKPAIQNKKSTHDYKYDAEETRKRQEAMDRARSRLQEQHAAKAERFAEEQRKKDEQKRQEKLEDWQRHQEGRGYRSKVKTDSEETEAAAALKSKAKKNVYRNTDYNPMTGSSGGSTYRPARRGVSGGG